MKRNLLMIAFAAVLMLIQSCSKKEVSSPSSLQTDPSQTSLQTTARVTPLPGRYTVTRYVDEGVPSVRIFRGYVFTFRSNGVLVARVNNTNYFGTWEMEQNNTRMDIEIEGTDALKEIDRNWDVVSITNTKISLNNDGGEHILVFTIVQ